MEYFVKKDSIVREIWGKGDTILFIFAGAAAEFALNKAVDWLYFTGKLPADPLGRLFSTVTYARMIVFSEYQPALHAIDKISSIHKAVEKSRGDVIPDWAYRDVLFMLIDYSIRSFEILERKLTEEEKLETFDVFYRMGMRMNLRGLPQSYNQWLIMRKSHLHENLIFSDFTKDLFLQYKKHLGTFRYILLKQAQGLVVPEKVGELLSLSRVHWIKPVLSTYKLSRNFKIEGLLRDAILPKNYRAQIKDLDVHK